MTLSSFIKDRLLLIILLLAAVGTSAVFMGMYGADRALIIYVSLSVAVATFAGLTFEYVRKKIFYDRVRMTLNDLDEKYLLSEVIEEAGFEEGRILNEILSETGRSHLEHVEELKRAGDEYKDFLELWIHEVKIPIAAADLMIKNSTEESTKKIGTQLALIDDLTEQALFYARSNTLEKDYFIVKCDVREIVYSVIRRNKETLIAGGIKVKPTRIEENVYTDGKWFAFILNQIVNNSIKYMAESAEKTLGFECEKTRENVILSISDTGCGINAADLPRIFDKGFTGSNGRLEGRKATGIGLYLCKKLCDKMGVGIEILSSENAGTTLRLIFPRGSFTQPAQNLTKS